MGRAALDLLRLAPEIVALQQAHRRSTVAILCPNSSLSSDSAVDEMEAAYEGLYFLDTPIRFVTDRGVKSGELESVKMLIAPGCTFVDDATVEGVERFVERGGSLVRTGSSFRYSEYGRIRTKSRLSADPEGRMEKKRKQIGDGWVITFPQEKMGPKEYAAILDGVLDGCGIPRPLRVVDHLHNRQSGVRMQTAEYEGRHLVYLVNLLARRRTVRIVSEGSVGEMVDLISGHVCGPLLELDPLEPMLFEIG